MKFSLLAYSMPKNIKKIAKNELNFKRGDVVIDKYTKSPYFFICVDKTVNGMNLIENMTYREYFYMKYNLNINDKDFLARIHILPEAEESAIIQNDKNLVKNNIEVNDLYFPTQACENVGVSSATYFKFVYVPSILGLINEKVRYKIVSDNIILQLFEPKSEFADLIEQAFACKAAQRGFDYEKLELLGDVVLKYLVTQNVNKNIIPNRYMRTIQIVQKKK